MDVVGNAGLRENVNVVSLFGTLTGREIQDPLQTLLNEAEIGRELEINPSLVVSSKVLVTQNQFPDQSIYLLEKQLENLNKTMKRLKFYMADLGDLLPR